MKTKRKKKKHRMKCSNCGYVRNTSIRKKIIFCTKCKKNVEFIRVDKKEEGKKEVSVVEEVKKDDVEPEEVVVEEKVEELPEPTPEEPKEPEPEPKETAPEPAKPITELATGLERWEDIFRSSLAVMYRTRGDALIRLGELRDLRAKAESKGNITAVRDVEQRMFDVLTGWFLKSGVWLNSLLKEDYQRLDTIVQKLKDKTKKKPKKLDISVLNGAIKKAKEEGKGKVKKDIMEAEG